MTRGMFKRTRCALHFHNDAFFGLTKSDDRAMFGRKAGKKWESPNNSKKIAEEVGMLSIV